MSIVFAAAASRDFVFQGEHVQLCVNFPRDLASTGPVRASLTCQAVTAAPGPPSAPTRGVEEPKWLVPRSVGCAAAANAGRIDPGHWLSPGQYSLPLSCFADVGPNVHAVTFSAVVRAEEADRPLTAQRTVRVLPPPLVSVASGRLEYAGGTPFFTVLVHNHLPATPLTICDMSAFIPPDPEVELQAQFVPMALREAFPVTLAPDERFSFLFELAGKSPKSSLEMASMLTISWHAEPLTVPLFCQYSLASFQHKVRQFSLVPQLLGSAALGAPINPGSTVQISFTLVNESTADYNVALIFPTPHLILDPAVGLKAHKRTATTDLAKSAATKEAELCGVLPPLPGLLCHEKLVMVGVCQPQSTVAVVVAFTANAPGTYEVAQNVRLFDNDSESFLSASISRFCVQVV